MNKAGGLGMRLHQAASFSPPLMRVSRGEAVFWPGCALMGLGPELLERVRAVLEREEPMGLSTCCCGQPSRWLFPGAFPRRQEKLRRLLAKRGIKRVYTACPNCAVQLRALGTVEQGAVRFSFSHYNTEEEVDTAVRAVEELARE